VLVFFINPGFDDGKSELGFFGSAGAGGGVNVSADIFVGFVKGGVENIEGKTLNINVGLGPVSVTVMTDPKTGDTVGGTIGVGPGATPVSASGTGSITKTIKLLEPMRQNQYPSLPAGSTSTMDCHPKVKPSTDKVDLQMMPAH
jgi:hypothetical protein